MERLSAQWSERLAEVRKDAVAHRVMALLPAHPVLGGDIVASELGVSENRRAALDTLGAHGILEPFASAQRRPGRPRHWWVASELLALVGAWSRSAKAPAGCRHRAGAWADRCG